MPETAIGLFPDIGHSIDHFHFGFIKFCISGATYFLSRLPDGIGLYLGLTGARLNAADVIDLGIATHFVPKSNLNELMKQLMESDLPSNDSEHISKSEVENILS